MRLHYNRIGFIFEQNLELEFPDVIEIIHILEYYRYNSTLKMFALMCDPALSTLSAKVDLRELRKEKSMEVF